MFHAGRIIGILEDRTKFLKREIASLRSAHKASDAKRLNEDVCGPAWTISSWLTSLSLLEIVAQNVLDSRPADDDEAPSETQWIKAISDNQMEQAIDHSLPELKTQIINNWRKLKRQEHVDATEMNQKFLTVLFACSVILLLHIYGRNETDSHSATATWRITMAGWSV